jgi:ElaB/YqjD/DUF883 family membrane-anchored ribosome-binding protein
MGPAGTFVLFCLFSQEAWSSRETELQEEVANLSEQLGQQSELAQQAQQQLQQQSAALEEAQQQLEELRTQVGLSYMSCVALTCTA